MLSDEPDELSRLLMSRINQCPPAAQVYSLSFFVSGAWLIDGMQAIIEAANRCAAMRDDLSDDDKEMIFVPLEPILQVHVSNPILHTHQAFFMYLCVCC